MLVHMPDEDEKPDPIEDVRKGLGLLFRAARSTIGKLPTRDFEEAVVTGAREVGRAIGNVGKTIERDVFGKTETKPEETKSEPPGDKPKEEPKPPSGT
jgi:hypothetical protein